MEGGAAFVVRAVPWLAIAKGTGKLAINIVRYSMGIAIYGLVIWPYRLLVGPSGEVAVGPSQEQQLGVVIADDDYSDGSDEHSDSVNGNIYVSVGEGSFHATDHDRLDTV